ncbi:universal stress protein [Acidocella aromatica]|uniref:Nucleotide-binding universal stress UspA family protein n=1 Tax=Acidocella aromatica TaxID=1303579 RepID=A0A840VNZ5_9PROT|nr:universal stress protein [Acidocella aromatica]MBB5373869.1 nucleotide-binding universal stress UspA family protein [Acidocella aromatica]
MALRDILVYLDDSPGGLVRMRLAADLARRHQARLAVLYVMHDSDAQQHSLRTAELGLLPAAEYADLEASIASQHDGVAAHLKDAFAEVRDSYALKAEWYCVKGANVPQIVIQHARCADLTIVGGYPQKSKNIDDDYALAETLLFTSGRPVIIVPVDYNGEHLGNRIAIGWDASRTAARALSDALSLIERAQMTSVMTINPAELELHGALPVTTMVNHLRLHCDNVEMRLMETGHMPIGDALQAQAKSDEADLLVAGACGHLRLWKKALGGVAEDILARLQLPVLVSA